MAVNLSPYAGVGAQFFDSNGNPLSGGKIYTYAAGTTTPQATFTSATGLTQLSNPIVLNAAGRVSTGEIWLTDGSQYKFVLKDANEIVIATYDNISGINSSYLNYTTRQEFQTATAGQTVFTLTTMQYHPGTNSLSVFVDGINQYGPGAQYSYVETNSSTVTFNSGLSNGAKVKFTTAQLNTGAGQNASQVTYTPPFVGSVLTTVENRLAEYISVKDFGASSSATAAANLTAFKAAVAATPVGGTLLVPADLSYYSIDTSGGLSTAVTINKSMCIVIEGEIKATYGTMQTNPPYIFNVTATGVTISGPGTISGDGTVDDTNSGDITTFPGLIRVAADNFTMTGLTLNTPPKVAVTLVSCEKAKIIGNTFMGGPTSYTVGNTGYFAMYTKDGGYHTITDNLFVPSAGGGAFVNCVFFLNTNNCRFSDNVAKYAWEKIVYLYGNHNIVANNTFIAPLAGSYTDAYRLYGSNNKLTNNTASGAKGGCQIFDGKGNEIIGNNFIGCTQAGIIVDHTGGTYAGGFSFTKIIGNTVTGGTGTKTDGIRVTVDKATSSSIVVSNNIVNNMTNTTSEGLIRITATSPYGVENVTIANNNLSSGTNGIYLSRVVKSLIQGNIITSATNYAMVESNGAYNKFTNNKGVSISNIGINGLDANSYGEGNQYTDAPLVGVATLANAITTTVTHGGVAANARIFLQTTNDTAGVLIIAKGWPTTTVNGANFDITMANGTASGTTTAQFYYNIIQ